MNYSDDTQPHVYAKNPANAADKIGEFHGSLFFHNRKLVHHVVGMFLEAQLLDQTFYNGSVFEIAASTD